MVGIPITPSPTQQTARRHQLADVVHRAARHPRLLQDAQPVGPADCWPGAGQVKGSRLAGDRLPGGARNDCGMLPFCLPKDGLGRWAPKPEGERHVATILIIVLLILLLGGGGGYYGYSRWGGPGLGGVLGVLLVVVLAVWLLGGLAVTRPV
jgi:hypothetical protein